jgi:hypothetical protein
MCKGLLDKVMRGVAGYRIGNEAALFNERGASHSNIPTQSVQTAATRLHGAAAARCETYSRASDLEIDLIQGLGAPFGGLKGRNMIAQGAALGTGPDA